MVGVKEVECIDVLKVFLIFNLFVEDMMSSYEEVLF